jgi:hypothetical protein
VEEFASRFLGGKARPVNQTLLQNKGYINQRLGSLDQKAIEKANLPDGTKVFIEHLIQ